MNGQLRSIALPRSQRGFASNAPDDQAYDLTWADARITGIEPVATAVVGTVLGALVDIHVHLDKSFTVDEVGAAQADLQSAIERMKASRAGWTEAMLHERMTLALNDAWRCGTGRCAAISIGGRPGHRGRYGCSLRCASSGAVGSSCNSFR
ncbi:MAG: hypothetical protein M3Y55_06755 [Pseudomonadota bacterium]|nr:hypothetical protein [Pseudomonadota bacterium]